MDKIRIRESLGLDAMLELRLTGKQWDTGDYDFSATCVYGGGRTLINGHGGSNELTAADAAGIVRARNRWPKYIALMRACAMCPDLPPRVQSALDALGEE